jgi:hypothetical protein
MPDPFEYEPRRIEPPRKRRIKIVARIVAGLLCVVFGLMMVFADVIGFETRWKDYLIGALSGVLVFLFGYVAVGGKLPN